MGLLDEISCLKDAPPYKEMTEKDFKVHLESFIEQQAQEKQRQFVVMTGSSGMLELNFVMQKMVLLDAIDTYKDHFDEQQRERLRQMLNSSDRENFEVAKTIINNVSNGHSK